MDLEKIVKNLDSFSEKELESHSQDCSKMLVEKMMALKNIEPIKREFELCQHIVNKYGMMRLSSAGISSK